MFSRKQSRRRASRLGQFQQLEARRMMAADVAFELAENHLSILGTDRGEFIRIVEFGPEDQRSLQVQVDGLAAYDLDLSSLSEPLMVTVFGDEGNDVIVNDSSLPMVVTAMIGSMVTLPKRKTSRWHKIAATNSVNMPAY